MGKESIFRSRALQDLVALLDAIFGLYGIPRELRREVLRLIRRIVSVAE